MYIIKKAEQPVPVSVISNLFEVAGMFPDAYTVEPAYQHQALAASQAKPASKWTLHMPSTSDLRKLSRGTLLSKGK